MATTTLDKRDPNRMPMIPGAEPPDALPAIMGGGPPTIPAPTPAASREAGKAEYQSGMPSISAAPFTSQYYQQEQAKNAYEKAHPLGSPISARPGTLGKIEHVLGKIGNVAGNIFIPHVMENIPGTELNRAAQTAENQTGFEKAVTGTAAEAGANAKVKQANAEEENAAANDFRAKHQNMTPEQLIASKLASGSDLNDPEVQNAISAIRQTQKPQAQKAYMNPKDPNSAPVYLPEGQTPPEGFVPYKSGPQTPPHITSMVNGQPHIMERDPNTGAYSIDRGLAPPSYAQAVLPTRTIQTFDANGMPVVMGYNPETKRYDIPQGTSSSGALGHELGQAAIVDRDADILIGHIQEHPEAVGNVKAIIESAFLNTPLADPVQSQLAAEIGGFAALNPSMHGFRGQQAMEQFEKLIGGIPKSPEALISAIRGFKTTAGAVNPNLNKNPEGTPKVGEVRTINGQLAHWDGHGWLAGKK